MKAILLIDHGSVREEANHMLECMGNLVQAMVGPDVIVRIAHMELAGPSVSQGFAACVAAGATEVVAFPYMLSPGKHSTRDIPRLVAEAADEHPHVAATVTPAFGVHEKLAELIAVRAGVPVANPMTTEQACRCWATGADMSACGAACRAKPQSIDADSFTSSPSDR